ncbi:MAG TPA: sigma-70 family RNA polymerase sigma factor, partial [Lacunisphaera sp.]|nr:sigma-70 family RNA polymerase sigma factor [Lacunisphaera sp.]
MKDSDLLTQFTQGSNAAFSELVRRHLDLVFATALRHVAGDRHRAEDITQQVFIALARKARTLTSHPALEGWLYSSTRYAALNALRREQRRSQREKQSEAMSTPTEGSEPRWEQIRPVIDEALQELDDDDRQSVVLRFFAQQPFATIAVQLGISENAAQKRVDRALDQLNVALKRRGIFSPAAALAVALGDSCI